MRFRNWIEENEERDLTVICIQMRKGDFNPMQTEPVGGCGRKNSHIYWNSVHCSFNRGGERTEKMLANILLRLALVKKLNT